MFTAIPTNLSKLDKSRPPENDFRNLFSNKPFNHRLSESFSAVTTVLFILRWQRKYNTPHPEPAKRSIIGYDISFCLFDLTVTLITIKHQYSQH